MWTCVWMLALENQRGRWGVRWPCPSCTRHRWCCIDTGGSEHWWTRRSCSETSSTWALAWWEDNPHCPVDKKNQTEAFLVLLLKGLKIPFSRKRTSSNSSVILRMISAFCMFRNISILTVPGHRGMKTGVWHRFNRPFQALLLRVVPLHPEHWMKKLMRSNSAKSLSCLYDSIHSSTTDYTCTNKDFFNVSFASGNRFLLSTGT